jgi:acyl dehydratase
MITGERYADLAANVGEELGTSDWLPIDQDLIDRFADLTGDHMWVHTDPERAARELAGGGPSPTACSRSP